jgi:hypothetical protein
LKHTRLSRVRGAAYELGELRVQYQEEVAMMRIVCHDTLVAAEQLGLNTNSLKREAIALAEQENKVIALTDHMERKEADYREKGMACFSCREDAILMMFI